MLKNLLLISFLLSFGFLHAQQINTTDKTLNVGKVEWVEQHIDAGKVPYGEPVTKEFHFKNISSENLVIKRVNTGCHCTNAEFSQQAIEPGQTGTITITYDGKQEGSFYRIIMVYTNFAPDQAVFYALTGTVNKKPAEPQIEAAKGN